MRTDSQSQQPICSEIFPGIELADVPTIEKLVVGQSDTKPQNSEEKWSQRDELEQTTIIYSTIHLLLDSQFYKYIQNVVQKY